MSDFLWNVCLFALVQKQHRLAVKIFHVGSGVLVRVITIRFEKDGDLASSPLPVCDICRARIIDGISSKTHSRLLHRFPSVHCFLLNEQVRRLRIVKIYRLTCPDRHRAPGDRHERLDIKSWLWVYCVLSARRIDGCKMSRVAFDHGPSLLSSSPELRTQYIFLQRYTAENHHDGPGADSYQGTK